LFFLYKIGFTFKLIFVFSGTPFFFGKFDVFLLYIMGLYLRRAYIVFFMIDYIFVSLIRIQDIVIWCNWPLARIIRSFLFILYWGFFSF
jgi:hypothetical protein